MLNILYLLPKNLLSRVIGQLMHIVWQEPIRSFLIRSFGKAYNINFDEAEKPVEEYKSIGDFFIRKLKPGLRPLGDSALVHPADSRISQSARLDRGQLVQAKGKTYSVQKLLLDPALASRLTDGFFSTYYLCPTDYHRVHSPVSGVVKKVTHLPGQLWPVNDWSVERISDLFCVNERVVVEIEGPMGPVAVVLVGATNVGEMSIAFEPEVRTNKSEHRSTKSWSYEPGLKIEKGDEVGIFHMGSTVVMVAAAGYLQTVVDPATRKGRAVRVRESY